MINNSWEDGDVTEDVEMDQRLSHAVYNHQYLRHLLLALDGRVHSCGYHYPAYLVTTGKK